MFLGDTNIGRLILEAIAGGESTEKTASKTFDTTEANRIAEGLAKVASYPYKEGVYGSVQEIMKIASTCIGDAIETLKSVQARNEDLEKAAEVRSIIEDMVHAGIVDEDSLEEKVAELIAKDNRQLEIVKEAVRLTKGGKGGNVFFEVEKTASSSSSEKVGMFDGVIDA